MSKLFESIRSLLVSRFGIDPALVVPSAHLQNDLRLDSVDAIDLVLAINETLKVRIPESTFQKIHTVGDLVSVVEENVVRV